MQMAVPPGEFRSIRRPLADQADARLLPVRPGADRGMGGRCRGEKSEKTEGKQGAHRGSGGRIRQRGSLAGSSRAGQRQPIAPVHMFVYPAAAPAAAHPQLAFLLRRS